MSKEAMKLAKAWFERNTYGDEAVDVYDALCEALAEQPARPYRQLQDNGSKYFGESWDKAEQPAQQEPVECANGCRGFVKHSPPAQRTWVGLTDEEKRQLFEREDYDGWLDYINAIEAKLRSKNT